MRTLTHEQLQELKQWHELTGAFEELDSNYNWDQELINRLNELKKHRDLKWYENPTALDLRRRLAMYREKVKMIEEALRKPIAKEK